MSPRSCAGHLCVGQPGELPIHPGGTERGEEGGKGVAERGTGEREGGRSGREREREKEKVGGKRDGGRRREREGDQIIERETMIIYMKLYNSGWHKTLQ